MQHMQQLFLGFFMEILRKSKTVTANLQTADGFLEGFLIIFTDTHNLANGTHLRTQLILYALELFKSPASKLNYDIISVRNVAIQCAVFSTGDLIQCQAGRQHSGNQRNREACCLGCQCGGTGSTRVNLDDDVAICLRIMRPLYIGSADDLDGLDDLVGFLLQTLLHFLGNGQHGRGAEGIAGMNAQRVDIFNETYGDDIIFAVADNLQLQLFPAKNGLLHQNLTYQAGLQTSGYYRFQLFYIVYKTAACAAHRVSRTENNRVTQLIRNSYRLVYGIGNFAARHLYTQTVHGALKLNPVLAALNGVYLHTDYLDAVFIQNARLG